VDADVRVWSGPRLVSRASCASGCKIFSPSRYPSVVQSRRGVGQISILSFCSPCSRDSQGADDEGAERRQWWLVRVGSLPILLPG